MKNKTVITTQDVNKIASLAALTLSPDEVNLFTEQFSKTIQVVDQLNEIDTGNLPPTSSVTKLENITRPDEIDEERILTQEQALSNAKRKHKGFFVVDQILTKNE